MAVHDQYPVTVGPTANGSPVTVAPSTPRVNCTCPLCAPWKNALSGIVVGGVVGHWCNCIGCDEGFCRTTPWYREQKEQREAFRRFLAQTPPPDYVPGAPR